MTLKPDDLQPVTIVYRTNTLYNSEAIDIVEFYMLATRWEGEPQNLEPHLCSDIGFYDLANLPAPLTPSVEAVLKNLHHAVIEVQDEDWSNHARKTLTAVLA